MLTEKRNLVFKKLVTQWWELGTFLRSYPEKSFPSTQGFQFFSYRWLCGDLFVFFLMKLLVLRESRSLPFELIIVDSQWLFK